MGDIKTYSPQVIEDIQFPGISQSDSSVVGGSVGKGSYDPGEIPERAFPSQTIANDVISDSFDTQNRRILMEYEFAKSGAIQIGEYENTVSGDIRISPSGITARNAAGDTTFTLDATTGDATFKGTVAAGSLIAGRTDIGVANGNVYIDGANRRIIISDGTNDRILIGYQSGGF